MMMPTLADMARFLEELDGSGHPLILVRDPTTDFGWRLLSMEDLQVLWERLTAKADENPSRSNPAGRRLNVQDAGLAEPAR